MVIFKIQGGLGNQMFQYAFAKNLFQKNNVDFFLEKTFYDNFSSPKREFKLNSFKRFDVSYNTQKKSNKMVIPTLYELKEIMVGKQFHKIVDNFQYSEISLLPGKNYYIDGYWQSEKYFLEIQEELRNEFSPPDSVLNKLLKTIPINSNSVSIHIRRTDYVTSNGYHPVQTLEYYENALNIIGDYDNLFVFSDDIQWCKNNLNFKKMIFVESISEIEDLWLMSLCKNNIIANSTFSWWGAWLNKNPNKKVVSPIKWFGSQTNLNTSDIIPEDWLKI